MDMTIAGIKKRFSDVKNVDTETLHQWMNDTPSAQQEEPDQESSTPQRKLVLLDVRPAEEHAVSSIPSAVRVDPEESDMQKVMQKIQESAPVSAAEPVNVVMYCSVGYRSSILASKFQDFVDVKQDQSPEVAVYNLEGSIFKWANEGRRLTDLSGGETRFVHPYSKIWGLLLDRDRRRYSPA